MTSRCGPNSWRGFYRTRKSGGRERRVIGKAEITGDKDNPRFIVTDLTGEEGWAKGLAGITSGSDLDDKTYRARGDMENRIKQPQMVLFVDRTSTGPMASNRLRLWLSTFAYLLLARLRGVALKGTGLARATAGTIRLRLLKVAAVVQVSVRRVHVRMAGAFPMQEGYAAAHKALGT